MNAFYQFYLCQAKIFFRDRISVLLTIILPLLMGVTTTYSIAPSPESSNHGDGTDVTTGVIVDVQSNNSDINFEKLFLKIKNSDKIKNELSINIVGDSEGVQRFNEGVSDILIRGVLNADDQQSIDQSNITIYIHFGDPVSMGISELVSRLLVAELNILSLGGSRRYSASVKSGNKVVIQNNTEKGRLSRENIEAPSLIDFYFPNFLALAMLWLGLFSTAIPLATDRAERNFVQLTCAPISMGSFMISYVLWRLSVGVLQSLLFLLAGWLLLGINFDQSLLLFASVIITGNLLLTLFGVFLVVISRTVQATNAITQIANLALMFTSGLLLSLETVPAMVQYLSYINPMTYIGDMVRQSMSGYPGLFMMGTNFLILGVLGLVLSILIHRYWRWS